jgi:hypothetical protein
MLNCLLEKEQAENLRDGRIEFLVGQLEDFLGDMKKILGKRDIKDLFNEAFCRVMEEPMRKMQMHFEIDPELKRDWKAFFMRMPRGSETRILTDLMRSFIKTAIATTKEPKDDTGKSEVDFIIDGDREVIKQRTEESNEVGAIQQKLFLLSEDVGK